MQLTVVETTPMGFARHAERNLPRYTSYPTALAFNAGVGEAQAMGWAAGTGAGTPVSVYVHVPFCQQLCWYCGCHTSVPNGYGRIAAYLKRLHKEIDLWAAALGLHDGAVHLHFGGGSPNALAAADFTALVGHLRQAFRVQPDAEVAVELDPRALDEAFLEAIEASGVNRASLGVQTFDADVQAKVNRIQPFESIARAVEQLRAAGVRGVSFDLMYGLPGQIPASAAESARLAAALAPDRISVFGYAHVPWFKKHQKLIREEDLADLSGRWAQAEAADAVLAGAGYQRIGLDHYALAGDPLAEAARERSLHRNFQGYTVDPADVLVPVGASAIGRFAEGYVQNARAVDAWAKAVDEGRLAVERGIAMTAADRLRARVIERLMCDLEADVGDLCAAEGFPRSFLDEGLRAAGDLQLDDLCRVTGRSVRVPARARRLVRAVAACFDASLAESASRHAKAV
jgi:oxygen-independent coproporphyrinogen-3 oxidase